MKLDSRKVRHLLTGAAFFSTGGGGSLQEGLEVVKNMPPIELCPIDELNTDWWSATAYLAGSVNCPPLEDISRKHPVKISNGSELVSSAFKYLQKKMHRKIHTVLPVELGGYNTAVVLRLASEMGIPVIDGDLTGRSAPEIIQTSYFLGGFSPTPAAVATLFNEKIWLEEINDYQRFDLILRMLVNGCYGYDVGVAHYPLKLKVALPFILPGTLSRCLAIGALLDEVKIEEAIRKANGKIIFRGKLLSERFEARNGFTVGEIEIGDNKDKMVLKYKNEIYVALLNGTIVSKVPELIGIIGNDGLPVANTMVPSQKDLIVYTLPSPDIWLSDKGKSVFSLKYFNIE